MCGIMGYVGPRPASTMLLDGLSRLEYRGYDSAGIAVMQDGAFTVLKAAGKLEKLAALVADQPCPGSVGIGHTRWATHGAPVDINAHPHTDPSGEFVVVHNGIIENFLELKEGLEEHGAVFESDTDTEVLAHLIAEEYNGELTEAVRRALARAKGAYALVAMTVHEPDRIVAVRMISPLVVGLAEEGTILASDIPAVLQHTKEVLIIEDNEMVVVTADGAELQTIDGTPIQREPMHIEWDAEQAEKAGYEHFMLKEIFEQPVVITETLSGRLANDGTVELEDVNFPDGFVENIDRVWITACGTAYNAGLVLKELFERVLRIPVVLEYAHELRYSDPLITERSLAVAISQSGETADTLAAARIAKERGARLLAITNVVGSTLSREADDILYTRAGPEIAVASTKAYLAMLIAGYLLAISVGRERGTLDGAATRHLAQGLDALPLKAELVLKQEADIAELAAQLSGAQDAYFIGRSLDYAVATEGSLKLKEISYLHSEAMPAGELKHGTLALVTDATPVIAIVTQSHVYDKTISAIQEVKARGARVIAVAYEDDDEIAKHADDVIAIPRTDDLLSPVPSAIVLQLIAYHLGRERGNDIDQPRNLAKSVTVE
ncbi:MAG: glutamine--fructose-6-phosphate transaminase (isomerizing) [Acidimicrobiia bacterium]|nr:glutamine--fructose-6-phosphate transaminase (isomerizing) [Acidimicrobiia bacterium]MDH3470207.1 glutamine--fructose-6-phosphate transaminase (isomerizing) [Acidimicrobiia bacterium]